MKISKIPVSIICVNVGNKYSHKDTNRLYKMVKRNCTLPFIFYCLTDNINDLHSEIVSIEIDKTLDLEYYWWKVCLFNLNWNENVLYLDLDVIIQKNIDYIFNQNKGFKCLSITDAGIYYPYDGRNSNNIMMIPQVKINSSVMFFNPKNMQYIYDKFINNADYNMIHYYGLDRFISEICTNIDYFDFSKDYYYRAKGCDAYDKRYITKNGLIDDPNKTFCIMNQCKPEHYRGLEKYFI